VTGHYILVAQDGYFFSGATVPAVMLVKHRLENKQWALHRYSRNRMSIRDGDKLLFYVGGNREYSGSIYGAACVCNLIKPQRRFTIDPPNVCFEPPDSIIEFKDVFVFCRSIPFKQMLPELQCRPKNLVKWGSILCGGSLSISKSDYDYLYSQLI
jgi:hypothetical protein